MAVERNKNQFINGLEFANLAVCSDLPLKAWNAISEIPKDDSAGLISVTSKIKVLAISEIPKNDSAGLIPVTYKVTQIPSNGTKVIAFSSSPARKLLDGEGGKDLVEVLPSDLFGFLCTKKHPVISVHKTAINLFVDLLDELSKLKDEIDVKSPLIITGHSLGGSIASLFTLWLLDISYSIAKTSRRPLCITFGSPLLGDNAFQEAISEHPTWISCFIHIISNHDPIPKTLASCTSCMPFGTTLFLSDRGSACFEESGSVFELIKAMSSGDQSQEIIDYGEILKKLKDKAISGEEEMVGDSDINTFREGITLQIHAATGANEVAEMNALINKVEKNTEKFLRKKAKAFDHTKGLNEIKIRMAYMEWYKKTTMESGGYYDHYKDPSVRNSRDQKRSREKLVMHKGHLTQFWKKMVEEIEKMPKREGENIIRSRWLYGGTNYRRMVEPLDIAEYYKQGKTNYLTAEKARSDHYILLEKWQKNIKPVKRKKPCSMTEDSCFWAHVEEAILSCNVLKDGNSEVENKEVSSGKLIEFEEYVMESVLGYAVSSEIFKEGSSFMNWWNDYKGIKGPEYMSKLKAFMENEKLGDGSMVLKEYVDSS